MDQADELLMTLVQARRTRQRRAAALRLLDALAGDILQASETAIYTNAVLWSRVDSSEVIAVLTERIRIALMDETRAWDSALHLRNYLQKAAKNAAIDCFRRASAQKRKPKHQPQTALHQVEDPRPAPDVTGIRRGEARAVKDALLKLSPAERKLIRLRFDEGRSFAQIAALRGEPFSTTYRRFHEILAKLGISLRHLL
jgi:RNA polymerase sigma factor (sigma-70 family)